MHYIFILFCTVCYPRSLTSSHPHTIPLPQNKDKSNNSIVDFLVLLFSTDFGNHNFFFISLNYGRASSNWEELRNNLLSTSTVISKSGGTTNFALSPENYQNITSPAKLKVTPAQTHDSTQASIIFMPAPTRNQTLEKILSETLSRPVFIKDRDKFIFLMENVLLSSVMQNRHISSLKYKLVITFEPGLQNFQVHHLCSHCPHKIVCTKQISTGYKYFPDFQKNYFGHILKVTLTDKIPRLFEFTNDSQGKYAGKRGIFAILLTVLSSKFNFTSEVFPNGGGKRLPDGTWTGSIGDIVSGRASFCLLCGISLERYSAVEHAAPVVYEKVKFSVGLPHKMYTWMSIFWPFNVYLWGAIIVAFLCVASLSTCFMNAIGDHKTFLFFLNFFAKYSFEQPTNIPKYYVKLHSTRIITGFWLLVAWIITLSYKSKIVTFMAFPVYEDLPQTFEELAQTNYQIKFHYFPNEAYNSFERSTNPVLKSVFQRFIQEPDPLKCLLDTISSKTACIMYTSNFVDVVTMNLSDGAGVGPFRRSIKSAFVFDTGIVVERNAANRKNFQTTLRNFVEMGLSMFWERVEMTKQVMKKNSWIQSLSPESQRKEEFKYDFDGDLNILHLKQFQGAFVIIFGGLISAICVFLWEFSKPLVDKDDVILLTSESNQPK